MTQEAIRMRKAFFITVDTESDNQWDLSKPQNTENAKYIRRFQECCEKHGFFPTYLTDYSMASDPYYVELVSGWLIKNTCEVGMHLHAWDTPPAHPIDKQSAKRPYLIEYPADVMEEKISTLTALLRKNFSCPIVSHRAGRWAMNDLYFDLLTRYGFQVDCSVTPGVSWADKIGATVGGTDYRAAPCAPYRINEKLLELPVTIKKLRGTQIRTDQGVKRGCKDVLRFLVGKNVWLRPSISAMSDMKKLIDAADAAGNYLEFMIHSSEFMPGGSPYYQTEKDVDGLFSALDELFEYIRIRGYPPALLRDAPTLIPQASSA